MPLFVFFWDQIKYRTPEPGYIVACNKLCDFFARGLICKAHGHCRLMVVYGPFSWFNIISMKFLKQQRVMSYTIDVNTIMNSDVEGTECYSFGFADIFYDTTLQANVDLLCAFIVDNKGQPNYSGIVKLTSDLTGLQYHSGKGDETFAGIVLHVF